MENQSPHEQNKLQVVIVEEEKVVQQSEPQQPSSLMLQQQEHQVRDLVTEARECIIDADELEYLAEQSNRQFVRIQLYKLSNQLRQQHATLLAIHRLTTETEGEI